jgi:class 3 adenylate cyclase
MEPRIQYAKTSDGVSIAFWSLGEGMPFVHLPVPLPFSHIQIEWQIPEWRGWYERMLRKGRVIRYDGRGAGLSDRDVQDFSLDALLLDLEAVVDRLALEQFALFGFLASGPVAIAYAARHPERVSHLILWHSFARSSDWLAPSGVREALEKLRETDWGLYTETVTHHAFGWSEGEASNRVAALLREALTPRMARLASGVIGQLDVTRLLPQVRAPTLVMHRRQIPWLSVDSARELVSGIPDARLALLEGTSVATYLGDMEAVASAIDEFLGEGEPAAAPLPSGTAVILFADIVDSTALTERMGDAAFRDKARELDGALRVAIRECEGTPVEGKLLGDGVLAVFTSARQAIAAALRCGAAGDEAGLPLHLGLHAGDVIREEDPDGRANVYGGAVNIAARIASAAAPGEVLVSETVRSLARTSAGVGFEDRGEHELQGVSEPVRVWAVREGARG